MEPTLHNGQTIVVNRMAYKLPFLRSRLPSRDDIIVFHRPVDQQLLVKRCRLLPGDPIQIDPSGWLIAGKDRYFLTDRQKDFLEQTPRVPNDMVLVLGDNSFHSVDSRDYGFIPIYAILGKVFHRQGKDK